MEAKTMARAPVAPNRLSNSPPTSCPSFLVLVTDLGSFVEAAQIGLPNRRTASVSTWRLLQMPRAVFFVRAALHDPERVIGQRSLQRLGLVPWRAHPHFPL